MADELKKTFTMSYKLAGLILVALFSAVMAWVEIQNNIEQTEVLEHRMDTRDKRYKALQQDHEKRLRILEQEHHADDQ